MKKTKDFIFVITFFAVLVALGVELGFLNKFQNHFLQNYHGYFAPVAYFVYALSNRFLK